MNPPVISCLHATKRLPGMLEVLRTWLRRWTGIPLEWIFAVDQVDEQEATRLLLSTPAAGQLQGCSVSVLASPSKGDILAWNTAASVAAGSILVGVSDDFIPPKEWDAEIVGRLGGSLSRPAVLGVADPHGPGDYLGTGMQTMAICTRSYATLHGYYFYPEYISFGADGDFTQKATFEDVLIDGFDLRFQHDWHGGDSDPQQDAVHRRENLGGHKVVSTAQREVNEERCWSCYPSLTHASIGMTYAEVAGPPAMPSQLRQVLLHRAAVRPGFLTRRFCYRDQGRTAYLRGDYGTALTRFRPLREKYRKLCNGRFSTSALDHAINICEENLR
jgi:hypothetical protein